MTRMRSNQEELHSMTESVHYVSGGTRPDQAFATIQLQMCQAEPIFYFSTEELLKSSSV